MVQSHLRRHVSVIIIHISHTMHIYYYSAFSAFQPTPALSVTSGMSSPSLPSPSLGGEGSITTDDLKRDHEDSIDRDSRSFQSQDTDFVSRVSNIPLVNTALRAYEHSKASSRVVKVRMYCSPFMGFNESSNARDHHVAFLTVRCRDDGIISQVYIQTGY